MIQTAAIIWAVLATGLGIAAGIGWMRDAKSARLYQAGCRTARDLWHEAADARDTWRELYDKVLADLDAIHYARHLAAKKARAAQLAQRAVASTTEQIRKEIGR